MPFTPAHAAAALPFRRSRLILSALIVGTTAPDLEYFVHLSRDDRFGHTLHGVFLQSLPLALITLWLFHKYAKKTLIGMTPAGVRDRFPDQSEPFQFGGPSRFALILLSILIGMATHIAWDLFTHANTVLYRHWPILREILNVPIFGQIPIYKILQHGSTIVGLAVLFAWFTSWYKETNPTPMTASKTQVGS